MQVQFFFSNVPMFKFSLSRNYLCNEDKSDERCEKGLIAMFTGVLKHHQRDNIRLAHPIN
ncbi:hypothetical protein KDRO_E04200 [Kluyveromyces lactis]|nr:hypothetical protein KDRO_E04200 [Kluyveromyces lactis]